jgi:hypothetical protein
MIRVYEGKAVNLKDVCHEAGDMGDLVWDEVSEHKHGNQVFTNDSLFIYVLPSINGEEHSPVQELIVKLCDEVYEDNVIIFEVMW